MGGHRWGQALASLRKKGFVQPTMRPGGGSQPSRRIVFACGRRENSAAKGETEQEWARRRAGHLGIVYGEVGSVVAAVEHRVDEGGEGYNGSLGLIV